MESIFVRCNWGIQYTDALLQLSNIKSYIQAVQNDNSTEYFFKYTVDLATGAQVHMEKDILQTLRGSDLLTKNELFDLLKGWRDYFGVYVSDLKNLLTPLITHHNAEAMREFDQFVEEEEKKFTSTERYKTLNHLDFYEQDLRGLAPVFWNALGQRKVQYHRYYVIEKRPDLIDINLLPAYLSIVQPILYNFINVVDKYSNWHQEIKLHGIHFAAISQQLITKELPEPNTNKKRKNKEQDNRQSIKKKLKTNLSVSQLAYLFKLLNEMRLLNVESQNEICEFLADSFSTKQSTKLSVKNLENTFSNTDKPTAIYWEGKLKEMKSKASKI